MTVRDNMKFIVTIFAIAAVTVTLAGLGLKMQNRLGTVETQMLARAPTAPPLQKAEASPIKVAVGETVYVPVYSHVYAGRGRTLGLEMTLSIRNTDLDLPIVINSLRYYDTEGRMLREYLETPVLLEPMASMGFLVERRDMEGGGGASLLIDWVAEGLVREPLIEAVMVSLGGGKAFSFARSGRPVARVQANE